MAIIITLLLVGVAVGFINTLAGGATILTLSALMFLGLPVTVANGTHRIAAIFQTSTSVAAFRRGGALDLRTGLALAAPTVAGSIAGSLIAVRVPEETFARIAGVMMLFVLYLVLFRPHHWLRERLAPHAGHGGLRLLRHLVFFGIGVYGGFIHIGVGYLLLAGLLATEDMDLVRANAVKVLLVLIYLPFSLAVFVKGGLVHYSYGLVLAVGQAAGAYAGAHTAVRRGAGFVRWFVVAMILILVPHLFGWYDLNGLVRGLMPR